MLLLELGYEVTWVGRLLPTSMPLDRPYATHRMKLFFKKGGLFYAEYNVRLFFYLVRRTRGSLLLSNDLDTLLPNYMASRLRGMKLVYDTHEYFCGVPEIQGRWVKRVWQTIERSLFPRLTHVWTVNQSIAQLYEDDYGIRPRVFRNISPMPEAIVPQTRAALGISNDATLVINQGSGMNVDRGLEEAVSAVASLEKTVLLLVGSGDAIPALKERVVNEGLQDKVKFVPRVPYAKLLGYTSMADVGLTTDKSTNINYRYSLPNKLFDYIHCGVPVVASPVVEVKNIVESHGIGQVVDPENVEALAAAIKRVAEQSENYKAPLKAASEKLHWAAESQELKAFYAGLK